MKMVEILPQTAEAICNLLYTKDGVDLSPIIKDLGGEDNIVVRLNVGLVMKGYKPEFDMSPRRYYDGDVFTPVNFSLILGKVEANSKYESRVFTVAEWMSFSKVEATEEE